MTLTVDTPENRATLFAQTVACLMQGWHIRSRRFPSMHGDIWMLDRPSPFADTWLLCDNGGEMNCWMPNVARDFPSVAYTRHVVYLIDAWTLAYRLRTHMAGQPIDYEIDWSDMELPLVRDPSPTLEPSHG